MIRFNALTGHVQRRFIADWRTAEDRKARKPGYRGLGNAVFGADGRTLASSVMDWIHVWDVESGTPRGKIRSPGRWARRLALAPDGRSLAASDFRDGEDRGDDEIRLYDVATGQGILTLRHGEGEVNVMAFSPDGTRLFTGFDRGTGMVWDVRRGEGSAGPKD